MIKTYIQNIRLDVTPHLVHRRRAVLTTPGAGALIHFITASHNVRRWPRRAAPSHTVHRPLRRPPAPPLLRAPPALPVAPPALRRPLASAPVMQEGPGWPVSCGTAPHPLGDPGRPTATGRPTGRRLGGAPSTPRREYLRMEPEVTDCSGPGLIGVLGRADARSICAQLRIYYLIFDYLILGRHNCYGFTASMSARP